MAFGLQRSIVEGIFLEYTMRTLGIYGKFVVRMNEKNNNVKQGLHTASYLNIKCRIFLGFVLIGAFSTFMWKNIA